MGLCTTCSSQTRVELITDGDTAKYKYRTSLSFGWLKRGRLTKYAFKSWKALSYSGLQQKAFFNILKNMRHLSVEREMNRFNATILPVNYWSCFVLWGACIFRIALIFSGLASVPLWETINQRNFLEDSSKVYLEGLSSIPYRLNVSKASIISSMWSFAHLLYTSISSTDTSIFRPICSQNILLTSLWYVAPTFFKPKGITW